MFRRRRGMDGPPLLPYARHLGFHADEDNGLENPLLVSRIVDYCEVDPASNMQGAMALWRHIHTGDYALMLDQRAKAAAYNCESPTIILVPFTNGNPGSDDPGTRAAQEAAILADLPGQLALYAAENPIFGFGNLTGSNYMPGATGEDRNAAWFAFEGAAFAIIEAAGYRWCATDDLGLVSLCNYVLDRRAAWTAAGVVDVDACEFFCTHEYVVAGFVPALLLLAEASLARAGVPTPIRVTEMAFGFLGVGVSDADKPWLFTEYAIGNGFGYPPQSLTWTRLLLRWFRTNGRHMLLFDWTMMVRSQALSSWGTIFTEDQRYQPDFEAPALGSLWFNAATPTRAYVLRETHGGTVGEATAAAQRITDGYLFDL